MLPFARINKVEENKMDEELRIKDVKLTNSVPWVEK